MTAEEQFALILDYLREQGHTNPQRALKGLTADELPEELRSAFTFWQSLSGPSRNFMFDIARGHRTKKTHTYQRQGCPQRREL